MGIWELYGIDRGAPSFLSIDCVRTILLHVFIGLKLGTLSFRSIRTHIIDDVNRNL